MKAAFTKFKYIFYIGFSTKNKMTTIKKNS